MRTSSTAATRPRGSVVIVDPRRRAPAARGLEEAVVFDLAEALAAFTVAPPSAVVLTGEVDTEAIARLRAAVPAAPVIALPDAPTVPGAVAAIRAGAADYLADPEALADLLARLGAVAAEAPVDPAARLGFSPRLTRSARMLRVFDALRSVARTDATVLVRGESGTGVELVPSTIHAWGRRADGPLVRLGCAAAGEGLAAELFGDATRAGAFARAERGTLVLEDFDGGSPAVQQGLLRALEERRIRRGAELVRVDVRLVVTTQHDLAARVAEGRLREDLYYRLDVFPVAVPALRERAEDVPLLVAHFLADAARTHGLVAPEVPSVVLAALQRARWPGNVRQLRALCERLAIQRAGEAVRLEDLPGELGGSPSVYEPASVEVDDTVPLATLTERVTRPLERAYLHKLLTRNGGHLQNTAAAAGITRRTLYSRMKELGLDAKDYK